MSLVDRLILQRRDNNPVYGVATDGRPSTLFLIKDVVINHSYTLLTSEKQLKTPML